jgi:hypothetical protein
MTLHISTLHVMYPLYTYVDYMKSKICQKSHCLRELHGLCGLQDLHGPMAFVVLTAFGPRWQCRGCPDDTATAGNWGRCRAGQLRFGFDAVSVGQIVCDQLHGNQCRVRKTLYMIAPLNIPQTLLVTATLQSYTF